MPVSRLLLTLSAATALLFGLDSPLRAGFRLRVEDTGSGVGIVVTDGGANDLHPATDVVMFSGSVGTFIISIQTGLATPGIPLGGFYDAIDLNAVVSTTSPTGGTLRMILEKDGLTGGSNGGIALEGRIGGVMNAQTGAEVTFQSWANGSNLMPNLGPDTGPPAASMGGAGGSPPGDSTSVFAGSGYTVSSSGAFSASQSVGFTKSGPYSLFSSTTVTLTGPGTVTLDHTTGTNPAPAGLVLLAAGVPFLAYGCWRRKRRDRLAASLRRARRPLVE